VTITNSPLDAVPPWGCVALVNVQGIPAGTKCVFNGVTQRLVPGPRGELQAIWLVSGATGLGPKSIQIYNDVNGVAAIVPGSTVGVGEVFAGRVMYLPTLAASQPASDRIDTTATTITAGGQNWQLMRKPRRSVPAGRLGPFATKDVYGGALSTLVSGANPAGVIDLATLIDFLAVSRLVMVCYTPSAGMGAGTVTGGLRFDQAFMQANWLLARPLALGAAAMDQDPLHTWGPQWQEAS
jgi:hypothetical protein